MSAYVVGMALLWIIALELVGLSAFLVMRIWFWPW